jgi:hypothetical protein
MWLSLSFVAFYQMMSLFKTGLTFADDPLPQSDHSVNNQSLIGFPFDCLIIVVCIEGKALKDEPSVQIVKMDATANDVPPTFVVHGFPTLYWYPKNKSVQKYEGGREVSDFLSYISKHATDELNGYDRSGEKKDSTKDEL